MKIKKLFLKIYLFIIILSILSLIIFYLLGNKNRIGYLGDFEYNIDNTLRINGLLNIKDNFIVDGKLDYKSINNFIFTNDSITNYSYGFRIKYYDKVFRNNDIYNVYIDINKIIKDNNFIEEIEMRKNGSPYGDLISYKIIDYEKIDNINYYLKIKNTIIFYFSLIMAMLFVVIFFDDIKSFVCKETNRTFVNIILIVYILFLTIYSSFILFNNFGYEDIKYFILFNILLCVFINNIYTKNSTLKNILNVSFLILFSISKNISLIYNTQLWSEDGRIFLQQYIDFGTNSIFIEYAGYYHLLPRILTIISFNLSKIITNTITFTILFMNLFAIIIGTFLISYIFLSKECNWISNYNLKILLSLLIISIPFSPEVFFNLTNLH
ncbi:hypothetical protein [Brachyspira hyodysenteriae]|uniref:hypothetical protein n=1 Tax=Brachyspira hyodysenteriae TaxID=159 RepID=UPI0022CDABA4|nr:hypothetical protein [Brachyspira hyodysenteriae]MCZ9956236.1 hypothetical protein [Brachyspira hyodysenteriae]